MNAPAISTDVASVYCGDCLEVLPQLEAESVHCCVTSPPYFGLRSYDEHSVRIDPSLDEQTRVSVLMELEKRGVHAKR